MDCKLVSSQEFDAISQTINDGEGIPFEKEDGYRVDTWLSKANCYHPEHGYYIPKDKVTEKYVQGFEDVDLTIQINGYI
jgi:hypothetical protein